MNLVELILSEMMNDDEPSEKSSEVLELTWDRSGRRERQAIDEVLIALTGWSYDTLQKKLRGED